MPWSMAYCSNLSMHISNLKYFFHLSHIKGHLKIYSLLYFSTDQNYCSLAVNIEMSVRNLQMDSEFCILNGKDDEDIKTT